MSISRGSIHHTIADDLGALILSIIKPSYYLDSASRDLKSQAKRLISEAYDNEHVTFFPYARSCWYAFLRALNLPVGTEILMTPYNIQPMLEIVQHLGYNPVFVDINLDDFGPSLEMLEHQLKRKPGCFLLTYLFGCVPDLDPIVRLCEKYSIPLVEDISQAIGASYAGRKIGTFGQAAIYSASLTKFVDSYNGAFILSKSSESYAELEKIQKEFASPSHSRIRGIIFKTLTWNVALNHIVFNALTFPALKILKGLSPEKFESLLGPSILVKPNTKRLPDSYFENIANIQLLSLIRYFKALPEVLQDRKRLISRIHPLFEKAASLSKQVAVTCAKPREHVYWQYLVQVKDVNHSRNILFANSVETGTTNLPNLAFLCGVYLENADRLKKEMLFIPLHDKLNNKAYAQMAKVLFNEPLNFKFLSLSSSK